MPDAARSLLLVMILGLAGCQVNSRPAILAASTVVLPAAAASSTPGGIQAVETPIPSPNITRFNPPVQWPLRGAAVTGYWNTSYSDASAYSLIDHLKKAGVNSIELLVSWFQPGMRSSALAPEYNGQSPTDESVGKLIGYIHQQGMSVLLKPHAEPLSGWAGQSEGWRGVIDPADREAWFASYQAFILHYAQIAASEQVEMFCVGSEMPSMTRSASDQRHWIDLADQVRAIYPGKVLYHATWYEMFGGSYEENGSDGRIAFSAQFSPLPPSFWSHFDFAGVGAYFDLYSPHKLMVTDPGVDVLINGWFRNDTSDRDPAQANLFAAIAGWQTWINRPVIFVEAGYKNLDFAAYDSYEYDPVKQNGKVIQPKPNDQAQANAYEATFEVWGGVTWLAGAFWWQFNPDEAIDAQCGDLPAPADVTGYSPCGRPALAVLENWYQ